MTGLRKVGVFIQEMFWLENSLSLLAQAIFEPNNFLYKYSNFSQSSHTSYLPAYEDGTDRMFRNVGVSNSDAGESPRRKHTTFKTRRKFEIKNPYKVVLHLRKFSCY